MANNNPLAKLLRRTTTAKAKKPTTTSAVPSVEDPTLQAWIKEMTLVVRDLLQSGVTRKELVESGIAVITNGDLSNALKPDEEINLTVPAAVLNLQASGAYSSVNLNWETRPSKYFGINIVYRAEMDDFGKATQIGSSAGDVYQDYIGNNAKVYYWVRTVSKYGVEGDLSPSVYAETSIDVDYLIDNLENKISESLLDQELSGKITQIGEVNNRVTEEVATITESITTKTNEVRQYVDGKSAELKNQADLIVQNLQTETTNRIQKDAEERTARLADIAQMQLGHTKEVQDRIDGDTQVLGELNNYKNANDTALANVQQQVQTTITEQSAQGTRIDAIDVKVNDANTTAASAVSKSDALATAQGAQAEDIRTLQARMTAAEGSIETGADLGADFMENFYTKTEADLATAAKLTAFNASLVIGGVNVIANSEAARTSTASTNKEYLLYERSVELRDFYEANLGKPITISFEMSVPISGIVQVYCGNNSAHKFVEIAQANAIIVNKFIRYEFTVIPASNSGGASYTPDFSTIEFYGTYGTGRIPTIRKLQVEAGNKATAWSQSPRDTQTAINTNATAIQNTNTEVARVNGVVEAHSTDINKLRTDMTTADTQAMSEIGTVKQSVTSLEQSSNLKIEELKSSFNTQSVKASNNIWGSSATILENAVKNSSSSYTITKPNTVTGSVSYPIASMGLKVGDDVVLSYKLKVIAGSLTRIGGHSTGFTLVDMYINGVKQTTNSATTYIDLGTAFTVGGTADVVMRYKKVTDSNETRLYIQPNRQLTTAVTAEVSEIQLELGTARTPWKLALIDAQAQMDNKVETSVMTNYMTVANANQAIAASEQSLNTKMANDKTEVQGNINTVQQNLTDLQGNTTTQINTLTSSTGAAQKKADDADLIARAVTNGKMLFADPQFRSGLNNLIVYDNANTGRVKVERIARLVADNPTTSTHQVNVTVTAGASPHYGGFLQSVQSRANAVFLVKYLIKLPVGYKIMSAANSIGTGGIDGFIGDVLGTGKYETYYRLVRCGTTGSFSNAGHVYIAPSGAAMLTGTQTMTFPIAQIETYDLTDWSDVPPSMEAAFAEVKNSTIANTTELEAQAAQFTQFTSNLRIGGDNILKNGNFADGFNSWGNWGGATVTRTVIDAFGKKFASLVGLDTTVFKGISQTVAKFQPNTDYVLSFTAYTTSSTPQYVRALIHQAGGGNNDPQLTGQTVALTNSPKRYSLSFKSADLATKSAFNIMISGLNAATYDLCITEIQWEEASVASAWKPASGDLVSSATLTTNYMTKAQTDSAIASQVTTLESSLNGLGTNLMPSHYAIPYNSPTVSMSVLSAVAQASTLNGNEFSYKATPTGAVNTSAYVQFSSSVSSYITPVVGGRSYIVSAWIKGGAANTVALRVRFSDGSYSAIVDQPVTTAWTRISVVVTVPASLTALSVMFYPNRAGNAIATSNYVELTRIMVEEQLGTGTTPSAWQTGDSYTTIKDTTITVDGIKALKMVNIDNNGVVSGYGLSSELVNGQVTSTFGVYATQFFVANPSSPGTTKVYPLMIDNGKVIMNTAIIKDGTIQNAQIGNLSADKITTGNIAADRMKANIVTAMSGQFTELSAITAKIGVLRTSTQGRRFELTDNGMYAYDDDGQLCAFFGSKR